MLTMSIKLNSTTYLITFYEFEVEFQLERYNILVIQKINNLNTLILYDKSKMILDH